MSLVSLVKEVKEMSWDQRCKIPPFQPPFIVMTTSHRPREQMLQCLNSVLQMCSPPTWPYWSHRAPFWNAQLAWQCIHEPIGYLSIKDKLFRENWQNAKNGSNRRVTFWFSPRVLKVKKDGSIGLCVNYQKVKEVSQFDNYPINWIDKFLDQLAV